MIDVRTGQVTIGRLVISRDLQRGDFVASAFFASGYSTNPQQDWYRRQLESDAKKVGGKLTTADARAAGRISARRQQLPSGGILTDDARIQRRQ